MEDPEREIAEVARLIIGAADPELQDAAVLKCVLVCVSPPLSLQV